MSNYQVLGFDGAVDDLPEQSVVLLVADVEDEAAVLVLVLGADVAVVQVEQVVLDFVAQLKQRTVGLPPVVKFAPSGEVCP
jgi:hypothetical protein